MGSDNIWVTPGDGVVHRISSSSYSNENFVSAIHSNRSSLGYILSSRYPSPTTISLTQGIPQSWVKWDVSSEAVDNIALLCTHLLSPISEREEIPASARLCLSRREQSERMREIAPYAHFSVTPRGIKSQGTPISLHHALSHIVAGCYMIVEKSTVAAIRSEREASLSSVRQRRFDTMYSLVSSRDNIIASTIVSAHTEPSLSTSVRFFYLASIVGVDKAHELCNSAYYSIFAPQVESIISCKNSPFFSSGRE